MGRRSKAKRAVKQAAHIPFISWWIGRSKQQNKLFTSASGKINE